MIGAVREVVTGQPPVVPSPVFAAAAVRSSIGRLMSGSRGGGLIARWADSVTPRAASDLRNRTLVSCHWSPRLIQISENNSGCCRAWPSGPVIR